MLPIAPIRKARILKPPVLIIGATSDIAVAIAGRFAAAGFPLQLAARNAAELERIGRDIELRHDVPVKLHTFDVLDPDGHQVLIAGLAELPGIAVSAVGLLGDQAINEADPEVARIVMRSNYEGPALLLGALAERFAARGDGVIVGISSVAGERGRATNYVYGSAKAGFTAFLSGLRNRFGQTPVRVISILPGFVATKMTEGMDLPPRLTASPEAVAEAVWRAVQGRRDIVYVKPIWRLVMAVVRAIPEPIFKKMRI